MSDQFSSLNVVTVANQKFFPGLWATLISAAAHASDLSEVTFHVVDGGIEPGSWKMLADALARHPMPPQLKRHELDPAQLEGLPLPPGRSPLAYARLLFPRMFEFEELFYLDSDLLIFCDITSIFKASLSDHAGAAVLNEDGDTLAFDLSAQSCQEAGKAPESHYFNTGVLLMRLNYWRQHRLAEKCFEFLSTNNPLYVDQTAINFVMNDRLVVLDSRWNRLANRISPSELVNPDFIVHYTSSKPWLVQQQHPSATLYVKFCSDTGLELKDRTPDSSPHNQHFIVQYGRSILYRILASVNSVVGKQTKAAEYSKAAGYWREHVGNRRRRKTEYSNSIEQINNTSYRPEWL